MYYSKLYVFLGLFLVTLSIPAMTSASSAPKISQITADNVDYVENAAIYLLRNGDLLNHWTIMDEGLGKISFPIELPVPNSTTAAVLDARIDLLTVEVAPNKRDIGVYALGYGGFMYSELPGDQWEYGFSHLRLNIVIDLDNIVNQSLANSWVTNILSGLEAMIPGITFLQFLNDTNGNTWTTSYRAYPSAFTDVWNIIYSDISFGQTLLTSQSRFEASDHKAIFISARWDEFEDPATADVDESDLRWEYDVNLDLYESSVINIQDSGKTNVLFSSLLGYNDDLVMPSWVNTSNLDIYLYKGAMINEIFPATSDDVQNRGLIHRDMELTADMHGTFSDSANFNFTHAQQSEPILDAKFLVNTTTVSENEDVLFTAIVENVGDQTAYNLAFSQNYQYILISAGNFNNVSGEFVPTIDQLEPGEKRISQFILRCNHANYRYREYQYEITYDAIADPNLINHWSRPQFQDRFTESSNRINLCFNPQGVITPIPWLVMNYSISDSSVQVGNQVTLTAVITNIGDVNATNVLWNFNPFQDWSNDLASIIGINKSSDSGIIDRINVGESVSVSSIYKADTYHRYFGGMCEWSVDVTYMSETEGTIITQDSDNFYYNDNGASRFLIYPAVGQEFGPYIKLEANFSKQAYQIGDIFTIQYTLTNIGTSTAYNVQSGASYQDGAQEFYVEWYSGVADTFVLGQLNANESVSYTVRYRLLKAVAINQISVCPRVQFSISAENPQGNQWIFATPNQIFIESVPETNPDTEEPFDSERVWIIIACIGVGISIFETLFIIKKKKSGLL